MAVQRPITSEPEPGNRGDTIATIVMMLGALVAVAGFAILFSLWWRGGARNDYEVLRIASQEYVNGHPILSGKLAESVKFNDPSSADPSSADPSSADPSSADPSSADHVESSRDGQQPQSVGPGERKAAKKAAAREAAESRDRWMALRDFLVGVGRVARANQESDLRQRRRILHDALPYLQSAREGGFPAGRMAQGYRILGESLFHVGRFDEAIIALERAIEQDPSERRNLLPMLAESQLNAVAPLTERALQTIDTYLADRTLPPLQRWEGELIRLRAMIALERFGDVRRIVQRELASKPLIETELQEGVSNYHDNLVLLTSIADVNEAKRRYGSLAASTNGQRRIVAAELRETMARITELQREATPRLAAQARLWSARALLVQGKAEDALAELTAVRQQRPFGAAAIVGGLEEIELLASQGRGVDMLLATRYMMRELGDDRGFDAGLISFDEFQRRIIGAIERLRQKGEFETAIDTARSLPPVLDVIEALTQEGIGFREWALSTIAAGTDMSGQVARSASIQARARFRAAGDAFAQAAATQFNSGEHVSTQWSAIEAYQQGRHFAQSIRLLKPYLRYESRRRMPRGLVAYGRALLAEDEPDSAIDALTTCIVEYPRDPLRYDARLLAALAFAEKGDLERARQLLQDNLQDGELSPQSRAWRDSLLTLGELLYERGYHNHLLAQQSPANERIEKLRDNQPILDEAVRRLDEAVQRYWPISRAKSAAYLSARAQVMSSNWPQLESQSAEVLDAARRTLRTRADRKLQSALNGFVRLRRHLAEQEDERRLPSSEQSILRNCLLAEADVLREMNRWEEASSAYRTMELRYMNEPPALEAILGRARCAEKLGRNREADMLIRQASVVLQRIPAEMNERFAETTRYDRSGWEQLLGWMNQRVASSGV